MKAFGAMRFCFGAAFLLLCSSLSAQQPRLLNYAVNEGLPSAEVYDVLQDSKGFMWFATDAGVCRYDSYSFQTYSAEDGLPDNTIFELYEDPRGRIWFGSYSGLLSYYENGRIVAPQVNDVLPKHLKDTQRQLSIYVDEKDTLWYGFRGKNYFLKIAPGYTANDVKLYESEQGLHIMEKAPGKFFMTGSNVPEVNIGTSYTSRSGAVSHFIFESKSLWGIRPSALSDGSLVLCANELHGFLSNGTFEVRKDSIRVIRILQSKNQGLWFCMDLQHGVHLFADRHARTPLKTFLKGYSVTDCVEDREGGIWFSTLEKGVFYMPYPEVNYYERSALNIANKFTSMDLDSEGRVLAGSSGASLLLLGKDRAHPVVLQFGKSAFFSLIRSLQRDEWLVSMTSNRAHVLRQNGEQLLPKNEEPFPFYLFATDTLSDGRRYVLDLNGVYELNRGASWKAVLKPLPERIRGMAIGEKDTVWLGGISGVWAVPPGEKPRFMGERSPLLGKRVDALLYQRNKNLLWMATKGAGIMLRRAGKVESYNSKNSAIGTNCRSLSEDETGAVWVATNEGAYAVRAKENGIEVKAFSEENGLPSNDILKAVRRDNDVWMLTPEGIIHFDIRNYAQTLTLPPVYLQHVLANGRPLRGHDSIIELEHDENTLAFSFTSLSFRNPGRLTYKYRLTGGDTSWAFSTSREAVFHRLAPGDYTFSVYACRGGLCSSVPAVFRFRIARPFWSTWWFTAAVCLALAGALALLFSYRIRRVKQKEMFSSRLAGMEMMALRAQMNPHFIFNAINSIQNFVLRNERNTAAGYLTKFARLIRNVLENSRQELIPLSLELETLRLYLELEALRFSGGFDFTISCDEHVDAGGVQVVPLILQPYAENAIRHGLLHKREKGHLNIRIEREGEMLRCIIDDDGIGREAARQLQTESKLQHQSMGVEISRKRLELLNQQYKTNMSVHFTDKKNADGSPAGTRVELLVPVINRKKI